MGQIYKKNKRQTISDNNIKLNTVYFFSFK